MSGIRRISAAREGGRLMATVDGGREAPRGLVWRPARSFGALVGAALVGVAMAGLGVLVVAIAASNAFETRLLAAGLAGALGVVLAVGVRGTWHIGSLHYALAPTAFEIRCGWRRTRIHYQWIEGVAYGRDGAETGVATLWPGAHLGCRSGPGRRLISRATVGDTAHLVVVETLPAAYVVSPAEPEAFGAALVARAREAGSAEWQQLAAAVVHRLGEPALGQASRRAGRMAAAPSRPGACSLLDRVAAVDAPMRALVLLALAVAIFGLARDVAHSGQAAPEALIAGAVLAFNTGLGPVLEIRLSGLGRLLMTAALAVQILATVW